MMSMHHSLAQTLSKFVGLHLDRVLVFSARNVWFKYGVVFSAADFVSNEGRGMSIGGCGDA